MDQRLSLQGAFARVRPCPHGRLQGFEVVGVRYGAVG